MSVTRIGLETGSTWVFASAVEWPGWPRDDEPVDARELARQVGLLRSWRDAFDRAVASAPVVLPKGLRGGRERDGIAEALLECDTATASTWPVGYLIRRTAWHVLDHAWELEDKSR